MNEKLTVNEIEQVALDTAIKAAVKAGKHILKFWPNPTNTYFDENLAMQIFEKEGSGNYATTADRESEKIIIQAIQSDPLFGRHRIVAEESDEIAGESEYQWVIDPIDGTPPFRNGLPEFGIAIGLLKGQEPVMGVIAMPALGQLIAARKGHGAKLLSFDGKVISELGKTKENIPPIDQALVAYDLGYEGRDVQLRSITAKIADKVGYTPCYGSVSTGNFRLAQGLIQGFFAPRPTKMDIAAAAAIIPEVGGVATDMNGDPIDWSAGERTYLAAKTPQIHSQLVEMLQAA